MAVRRPPMYTVAERRTYGICRGCPNEATPGFGYCRDCRVTRAAAERARRMARARERGWA